MVGNRFLSSLISFTAFLIFSSINTVQADNLLDRPEISGIYVDAPNSTVTVIGDGFQDTNLLGKLLGKHSKPDVLINGEKMQILFSSDKNLVVKTPTLMAGTYSLKVNAKLSVIKDVTAYFTVGATGPKGDRGPAGPAGAAGVNGAAGPMGPQGPAGDYGRDGVDGAEGPMGPQGVAGPAGPAGPQGEMGPQGPAGESAKGFVGSVETSIMPPQVFAQISGDNTSFNAATSQWVLADGRDVSNSEYATLTGQNKVPDMRGMFLRGMNEGRSDGFQDPDGARTAGSFQRDQLQGHSHASEMPSSDEHYPTGTFQASYGTGINANNRVLEPTTLNGYGAVRYGTETRSSNIAVYYYIRINSK